MFGLLKKYGGGTDGKGENHDLVVMASKLLVVLIRDVKITQIKVSNYAFCVIAFNSTERIADCIVNHL